MLTAAVWLASANPLVALAPSALYLADTATTLIRRALRGDSPFDAHREHAYQRLAVRWGGHMPALAFYAVLQVLCLFAAGAANGWISGVVAVIGCGVCAVSYLATPHI